MEQMNVLPITIEPSQIQWITHTNNHCRHVGTQTYKVSWYVQKGQSKQCRFEQDADSGYNAIHPWTFKWAMYLLHIWFLSLESSPVLRSLWTSICMRLHIHKINSSEKARCPVSWKRQQIYVLIDVLAHGKEFSNKCSYTLIVNK